MTGGNGGTGYGKPPRHTQFKKGQSGNPLGRPKKKGAAPEVEPCGRLTALQRMTLDQARKPVRVRQHGVVQKMEQVAAVHEAQAAQALQGRAMATRDYLHRYEQAAMAEFNEREARFEQWLAIVAENERQLSRAAASGMKPPALYPHPDDVRFDHIHRSVEFLGPVDAAEARAHAPLIGIRALCLAMWVYSTAYGDLGRKGRGNVSLLALQLKLVSRSLPPSMRWDECEHRRRTARMMLQSRTVLRRYLRYCSHCLLLPANLIVGAAARDPGVPPSDLCAEQIFGIWVVDRKFSLEKYVHRLWDEQVTRLDPQFIKLMLHLGDAFSPRQLRVLRRLERVHAS